MEFIPNSEQTECIKKLKDFVEDYSTYSITISGQGGVGKTSVVGYFLQQLPEDYEWVVTSSYNKAVRVISDKAGKQGMTLHKILGLKPNVTLDEFDPNDPKFALIGTSLLPDFNLIVCDESSTINEFLYNTLITQCKMAQTKIIFLGDDHQLPPINEDKSKVFKESSQIELTINMRTEEDNPLIPLFSELREGIHNENYSFSYYENSLNYKKDKGFCFYDNEKELALDILHTFPNDNKILCYTNAEVKFWNSVIRSMLFKTQEPLIEGDLLLGYSTTPKIINSEEYIIKSIEPDIINGINVSRVHMKDSLNISTICYVLDHRDKEEVRKFKKSLFFRTESAKKDKWLWRDYFEYRQSIFVMEDLYNDDGSLLTTKDLDYNLSQTCHKSQGSTYKNITIIYDDFMKNRNAIERNKLMYVAFSRASHKAYILKK